jgi:hypothetical protein
MNNKNNIALNNIFDRLLIVICLAILFFLLIHSMQLDTLRIDAWIESFEKRKLMWAKLSLYSGILAVFALLSFRVPCKVILTEDGIRLHVIFSEPQTIKWEDINRFEIIRSKRYSSQISLSIISDQFSTEGWPKKRPSFSYEIDINIDKAQALAEKKMIRKLADNGQVYPAENSQFKEDINN